MTTALLTYEHNYTNLSVKYMGTRWLFCRTGQPDLMCLKYEVARYLFDKAVTELQGEK